jgi:phage terminase large subunit
LSQSISELDIELPPKLVWVFEGEARYRGAYGGRGSAKTFSFALMTAVRAVMFASAGIGGIILCGREFMNSLDDSSMAEVKAAIASNDWLTSSFDVGENYIRTKAIFAARVEYKFAGLRHNLDSIKSKSRILILWIDEAEPVTETAWQKIVPTVRAEGEVDFSVEDGEEFFKWCSEIWLTWNPENADSATNLRFRNNTSPDVRIVEMNYRDNPWFPDVLNRERLEDKEKRPHSYEHIWEGSYKTYVEGAYFSEALISARENGRIGFVPEDPHMIIRLFADIGGTGAKADNFVFWASQNVGLEIRCVNHYEVQGQPIAAHLNWMRSQGYTPDKCKIFLPHDGDTNDKVFDVSYRTAFEGAGYTVEVIPNQGKGAAASRVEKARELFPRIRIDEKKCDAGLKALGWYHEKKDDKRNVGLGPNHDWSSHSADAFGAMCVAYEPPAEAVTLEFSSGGWMAA